MESPGTILLSHDPKNRRLIHISWTASTNKEHYYVVDIEESTGYKAHLTLPSTLAYLEYLIQKEGVVKVSVVVCDSNGIIGTLSKATYNCVSVSPDSVRNLRAQVAGTHLMIAWDAPESDELATDLRYHFMVRYMTGPDFGQTVIEQTTRELTRKIELPKEGLLEVSVAPQRISRWYGAEDTAHRGIEINDGPLSRILVNTLADNVIKK